MILWSTFAWAAAVAGQSTTDALFIGWYIQPDLTQRFKAGSGWTTSGTVAGDCGPSSTCALHTACTSGTVFFNDGGSKTCTSRDICAAWTIFENIPFGSPSATNWECRPSRLASKSMFYKNLPEAPARETTVYETVAHTAVASSSDTAMPTTSSTSTASSASPTSTPIPSFTPSLTTSAPNPPTSPSVAGDGPKSRTRITGAIIGSVAGLALCVTVYWLWMRYRNHPNRHHLGSKGGEAQWHGQIPDTELVEPQFEVVAQPMSSPAMLHADATRRTPELPG